MKGTSKNPFERKRATCTESCVKFPHLALVTAISFSLFKAVFRGTLKYLFKFRFNGIRFCYFSRTKSSGVWGSAPISSGSGISNSQAAAASRNSQAAAASRNSQAAAAITYFLSPLRAADNAAPSVRHLNMKSSISLFTVSASPSAAAVSSFCA